MRRVILIFLSSILFVPFTFGSDEQPEGEKHEKHEITLLSDPALYPCSEVYSHGEENVVMAYSKVKRYVPSLSISLFGFGAAIVTVATGGVGGFLFIPVAVVAAETIAVPTIVSAYGIYKIRNPFKQMWLDRRINQVVKSAERFLYQEGDSSTFKVFYKEFFKPSAKADAVQYPARDVALALNWLDHAHQGLCDLKPYHREEDELLFFRFLPEKEIVAAVKAYLDEKYAAISGATNVSSK